MSFDLDAKRISEANTRAQPHLRTALMRTIDHGVDLHMAAYAMIHYGSVAIGSGVDRGLFTGEEGAAKLREFAQATYVTVMGFAEALEGGKTFGARDGDEQKP
ncbi:MAG: hypothetical protein O9289_06095 [Rhodobacteraceae bacterium]|nr:hypothetical protein [Paracoccaceae bacterium]MCZ8082758.1 hypothetical protein [Paracoccaceae bacterium]